MIFLFVDLKFFLPYSHPKTIRGAAYARRMNRIFKGDGLFTDVWIAISIYVLVAIIQKRMYLKQNLYTILQILCDTLFKIRTAESGICKV